MSLRGNGMDPVVVSDYRLQRVVFPSHRELSEEYCHHLAGFGFTLQSYSFQGLVFCRSVRFDAQIPPMLLQIGFSDVSAEAA